MASKLIYQIKCDACGKMEHVDVKYLFDEKKTLADTHFHKLTIDNEENTLYLCHNCYKSVLESINFLRELPRGIYD